MLTRTRKPDVSGTDVSSKKMKIQKKLHRYLTKPDKITRMYKGGRYALTAQCGLFRNDGGGIAGGAEHRFEMFSADIRMPHSLLNYIYYVVSPSFSWSQ